MLPVACRLLSREAWKVKGTELRENGRARAGALFLHSPSSKLRNKRVHSPSPAVLELAFLSLVTVVNNHRFTEFLDPVFLKKIQLFFIGDFHGFTLLLHQVSWKLSHYFASFVGWIVDFGFNFFWVSFVLNFLIRLFLQTWIYSETRIPNFRSKMD